MAITGCKEDEPGILNGKYTFQQLDPHNDTVYFDGNIYFKRGKCNITGKRFNPFPYETGRKEQFQPHEEKQDGWFKLDSSKKTVEISPDKMFVGGWSISGTYRFFSFNNKSGVSHYIHSLPNDISYFLLKKEDQSQYLVLINDKLLD